MGTPHLLVDIGIEVWVHSHVLSSFFLFPLFYAEWGIFDKGIVVVTVVVLLLHVWMLLWMTTMMMNDDDDDYCSNDVSRQVHMFKCAAGRRLVIPMLPPPTHFFITFLVFCWIGCLCCIGWVFVFVLYFGYLKCGGFVSKAKVGILSSFLF